MQTTLLGIAIAIILALVAALVGPHFVDWSQYRAEFEAQASRLTGLQVRVTGPIDARLLPTPTLTLQRIEIVPAGRRRRRAGQEPRHRVLRSARCCAANGGRAEVRLEGADFALGLDGVRPARLAGTLDRLRSGHDLDPAARHRGQPRDAGRRRERLASRARQAGVQRRAALAARTGQGRGLVRRRRPALSLSDLGEPRRRGRRARAAQSRSDRPSADRRRRCTRPIEQRRAALRRHAAACAPGRARAAEGIIEPWRITSRIKGDSAAAVLEQIEFQYGPDDRAIKLRGDANLTFGRNPQLTGGLVVDPGRSRPHARLAGGDAQAPARARSRPSPISSAARSVRRSRSSSASVSRT